MTEKTAILTGAAIERMLDRACLERNELTVEVPGFETPFVSGIQEFLPGIRRIDIFRFDHTEADKVVCEGLKVNVKIVQADRLFRFSATCVEAVGKAPAHHLQVPQAVEEVQRRYYFRIAPPNPQAAALRIRYEAGAILAKAKVKVMNLSGGGVLYYDQNLNEKPEIETPLGLMLRLGGQVEHKVKGSVARVSAPTQKWRSGYLVGVKFENLDPQLEEILVRTIMLWQRQQRRDRITD